MSRLTIGLSKRVSQGTGMSWSSYWATRNPTALVLTVLSDTSIKLDWTANGVEDYDGYSVEISTDGAAFAEVDTVLVGTETYTDTGLDSGTLYYYRVRAYKGAEYSPYCDIVSETTVFLPSDFANGVFWYKADAITGLNNDDVVATWTDSFGINNIDQSDNTKRPLYKTNVINGLPTVKADGSNDYLRKTSVALNQPLSVYVVVKPVGNNQTYLALAGAFNFYINNSSGNTKFNVNAGTGSYTAASDIAYQSSVIGSFIINGANSKLYLNGGFEGSGTTGTNAGDRIHLFGDSTGSLFTDANIAELIGYSGVHDATNKRRIETYLSHKYAIELEPI